MKAVIMFKRIIEKTIHKKENRIKEKQRKFQSFSDWYWCIVCAKKRFNTPFNKRIKMYLSGFTSDQYHLYNLEKNKKDEYLTDIQRWKTRQINGKYNIIFDDKRLFYEVFSKYINIPKTVGYIMNKKFHNYESGKVEQIEDLLSIIKQKEKLMFRRVNDGGGKGAFVIGYRNNSWFENDEEIQIDVLKDELTNSNQYIISEYLEQLEYSNKIYSNSVNTIRIIVINNGDGTFSIPMAVHRFGTKTSQIVDNAASGGIFANVDINTGILEEAHSYYTKEVFEFHPDTKNQINGIVVPNWEMIKKELLKIATFFPYINFVAWDVVPTKKGFSVIEGNTSTAFGLLQAKHGIAKSELANFYKKYGI